MLNSSTPVAELHRHLDVCTRPATVLELGQKQGRLQQSLSLESFERKFLIRQPMSNLGIVLSQFEIFQKVLETPEILERVAYEAAEDCSNEGTDYVEFRFSPSFVAEHSGLSFLDVLEGFEKGLKKAKTDFPRLETRLICIASRDYGARSVSDTVEFFLKYDDRMVGIDLAGNEQGFPNEDFIAAFKPVVVRGSNITIHSGEAMGPDTVWSAIEKLGAKRIGHGVHSIEDPSLVRYLRDHRICLEICPTSNWLTQCTPTLSEHPARKLLQAGVPVSLNTDDPGIFALTLPGEITVARDEIGFTEEEISQARSHAWEHRFGRL